MVVAPPFTVSPPIGVPLPIVVDAKERRPFVKVSVVVVASLGNRYAKFASPRDEVLVSE